MTQRAETLLASFRYAGAGLRYLFLSQRNARIHLAVALLALLLAAILQLSRIEWAILTLTIGLVLVTEAINTAIEAIVDLITPDYHPLAKVAKDVAAGAVWLMAIAAVIIGVLLFLPRLLALTMGT